MFLCHVEKLLKSQNQKSYNVSKLMPDKKNIFIFVLCFHFLVQPNTDRITIIEAAVLPMRIRFISARENSLRQKPSDCDYLSTTYISFPAKYTDRYCEYCAIFDNLLCIIYLHYFLGYCYNNHSQFSYNYNDS